MAVTVNLQEVFPSDSQQNLTTKLNFNFNQLLTLGLGEPGPKGDKGDAGPIGPVGPAGGPGQRGSKIYSTQQASTPTGAPSLVIGSEDGDMFINSQKIYIKGVTVANTWDEVIDFQSLVNSQSLQDTYKVFQMGTVDGDSASKHSKFLRYVGADKNNTALATNHPQYYTASNGNATQLILSNFDETKTYRIDSGSLVANSSESDSIFEYTALQKIIAYLPSTFSSYRHQLEIGSVDELAITLNSATQQYVLTPSEQNLKFRKYRVSESSLTGALYNRADIDLSGANVNSNSLNGEIVLAVNKKTASATNKIELGLSTNPILAVRIPSVQLKTDGIILSRDTTAHLTLGFDSDSTDSIRLATTSNLTKILVKDTRFTFTSGNTTIDQPDTTKTIGLGTAVVVKNNRLNQGLPFPVTQVASSDDYTLDDYREGTWTPYLYAGSVTETTFNNLIATSPTRTISGTGSVKALLNSEFLGGSGTYSESEYNFSGGTANTSARIIPIIVDYCKYIKVGRKVSCWVNFRIDPSFNFISSDNAGSILATAGTASTRFDFLYNVSSEWHSSPAIGLTLPIPPDTYPTTGSINSNTLFANSIPSQLGSSLLVGKFSKRLYTEPGAGASASGAMLLTPAFTEKPGTISGGTYSGHTYVRKTPLSSTPGTTVAPISNAGESQLRLHYVTKQVTTGGQGTTYFYEPAVMFYGTRDILGFTTNFAEDTRTPSTTQLSPVTALDCIYAAELPTSATTITTQQVEFYTQFQCQFEYLAAN